MSAGEFFSLVAVILGSLTLVSILAGLYKRNLDFKERKLELEAQVAAAKAAPPSDRNDFLEERVRVLERIATDRSPELASQIEALRDMPRVEAMLEERNT
jgi:hypothetical protein